jgi:pimeloyl-ACP methyl ester carboxylesterase
VTVINTVQLDGLRVAYREAGQGPPVLLVHGWPTSSFLWRNVMGHIAKANRVVALDLPGFGESDKPGGIRYNFGFFGRVLDEFLAKLGIERLGLAVHDLGGPIGLHWAVDHPDRVTKLALLNTLVYPEFSEAVKEFVRSCASPELRDQTTSPAGLESIIRDGLADRSALSPDVLATMLAPFRIAEARQALADAGIGIERRGFVHIAKRLPTLRIPVRIIYGERDRLLPDVAETMARVKRDLPQAEVTALPACGHFTQEEAPDTIGELLARFFAPGF